MENFLWYWCIATYLTTVLAIYQPMQAEGRRMNCALPHIDHGYTTYRLAGVRFRCYVGFRMIGPNKATCHNGVWESEPPVCVRSGCSLFESPLHGTREFSHRNSVALITCNEGYVVNGSRTLICNGQNWNGTVPTCVAEDKDPSTFCDFDNDDLCGWSQDRRNNQDWLQKTFFTPFNEPEPFFDHTFGKGFGGQYMFTAGRRANTAQTTSSRLVSPVYPSSMTLPLSCFTFWYHMSGPSMGTLRIYQVPTNASLNLLPAGWEISGNQGGEWRQGIMLLSATRLPFQIVIEAAFSENNVSVVAIDDVSFESGSNCSMLNTASTTSMENDESCQFRCFEEVVEDSTQLLECGCSRDCVTRDFCCQDYTHFCVNNTIASNSTPVIPSPTQTTLSTATTILRTTTMSTSSRTQMTVTIPSTTTTTTTKRPTPPTTISTSTTTTKRPTTKMTTQTTTMKTTPTTINTKWTPPTTKTMRTKWTPPTTKRLTSTSTLMTPSVASPKVSLVPTTVRSTMLPHHIITAAVADEEVSEPNLHLMGATVAAVCAFLLLGTAIVVVLVRRHRLRVRARELDSDDSDVRFLTTSSGDMHLDFTLATP